MEYKSLSKNARNLMFITAVIQSLFLLVAGMAVVAFADFHGEVRVAVLIACAVVAVAYAAVFPIVRFKSYKYIVEPDRIEIVHGVVWVSRTVVPISKIHQINVSRGPLDSAFGVAKVSVITAGSTAVLRFLDEDKANEIALYLNEKVEQKSGGKDDVQ